MIHIDANPFAYQFALSCAALVIIDMQCDFIEPGGFGETLGNDVSLLSAIVPACKEVLQAWRLAGGLVVHTREAHSADRQLLGFWWSGHLQPRHADQRCFRYDHDRGHEHLGGNGHQRGHGDGE